MNILLKTSVVLGALLTLEANQPVKAALIEPDAPIVEQSNIHEAYWHGNRWGWHRDGGPRWEYHAYPRYYSDPPFSRQCWRGPNGNIRCRKIFHYY